MYIALTEFAREKFVEGGFSPNKVVVKPNFADFDPGIGPGEGRFALFVGRLAAHKGIDVLVKAWESLEGVIPLRIIGDGPMEPVAREAANRLAGVEYLGRKTREEVLENMRQAKLLVFPSVWYEGFPMTIIEAYGCGLPVIGSDLGGLSSIVEDGVTGKHFRAGDAEHLVSTIRWACENDSQVNNMRANARAAFVRRYSSAENYAQMMKIYEGVLAQDISDVGAIAAPIV